MSVNDGADDDVDVIIFIIFININQTENIVEAYPESGVLVPVYDKSLNGGRGDRASVGLWTRAKGVKTKIKKM